METKHVRIRDVNVNIWHKLKIIAAEKNVTMAKALEIVIDFYWQNRKIALLDKEIKKG
jgi:hypothetical protein